VANLLDLKGKTILITGGCGAIGRVVAPILAEHGAKIAVNDVLPEDEAGQLLAEAGAPGPNVAYFRADATQPDAVNTLFREVEERLGLPNVVCCHAGMVEAFPVNQVSFGRVRQTDGPESPFGLSG
jgi:NAD(P)-dependent dehydrogenase (short-subunit alcohol dehydrogenase family)